MIAIALPGCVCQPVCPPGAIVICWTTASYGSLPRVFTFSVASPRARIVPEAPEPGVATAMPVTAAAATIVRTMRTSAFFMSCLLAFVGCVVDVAAMCGLRTGDPAEHEQVLRLHAQLSGAAAVEGRRQRHEFVA